MSRGFAFARFISVHHAQQFIQALDTPGVFILDNGVRVHCGYAFPQSEHDTWPCPQVFLFFFLFIYDSVDMLIFSEEIYVIAVHFQKVFPSYLSPFI